MESVERYNIKAGYDLGDLFIESHKSDLGAWVRYEDHAAALRAERANTDTANAAAVTAYARVRELEALLDTERSGRAGDRQTIIDVYARVRELEAALKTLIPLAAKQAAEAAAGGKK